MQTLQCLVFHRINDELAPLIARKRLTQQLRHIQAVVAAVTIRPLSIDIRHGP